MMRLRDYGKTKRLMLSSRTSLLGVSVQQQRPRGPGTCSQYRVSGLRPPESAHFLTTPAPQQFTYTMLKSMAH